MNEDPPSSTQQRSWLEWLSHALSGEPRNIEELLEELRSAHVNGLLSTDTLSMLEGAIQVADLQVRDVMVPRAQMVALPLEAPLQEILATVIKSGHSRFPVHGEDKDRILGILLAKDLLPCFAEGALPFDISGLLRPVVLIPESKRLNILLKEFRVNRNHMAIVVDEYGGVSGLITIEDVLEQIVGDIDDEHDEDDRTEIKFLQPVSEGKFLVNALMPITEFNQRMGGKFSDEDFDTLGGLVTAEFGHLPENGEEIQIGKFHFKVTKTDDRRVHQFSVEVIDI